MKTCSLSLRFRACISISKESQPLSVRIFAYPKKAVIDGFSIPDNIMTIRDKLKS